MAKYFHDLKGFIESQYPDFHGNIEGGLYPPPKYAEIIAQISGYVWIGGIGLLMAGSQIFSAIGMAEPEWYAWMKNNKAYAFFGLFMLNNIGHSFLATGAFEVYLDGELIHSKLQMHRMPSVTDLSNALNVRGFKAY